MKKGFTLIELLAVIVILAIIATIATPIVLSIIEDTKKSATLRSAEFYLNGVETSIATATLNNQNINDGTYNILENGNICLEEYDENTKKCKDTDSNLDNNELLVEVKGDKPSSGTITITDAQISDVSLNLSNKVVMKNEKGQLVFSEQTEEPTPEKTLATICTHDATNGVAEKTAGAKYKCKVKEDMEEEYKDGYTFYVLKTPLEGDTTINLIMDQNINSDGTPAGMTGVTQSTNASKYNLVAWNNESGQSTNAYGPVTAMKFLYNATKDWTNIDPVNYTYNDKTIQGTTEENTSYTSFVSTNGVATITPLSGSGVTIGTNDYPLRARMPIKADDATITEATSKTNASYLYDNLDSSVVVPYGYWTLSSLAAFYGNAWIVDYDGNVNDNFVANGDRYGVRPVINLKI